MEALSPFTRRLVAIGILVFGVLLVVQLVVAPVLALMSSALADLAAARERLARTQEIVLRPPAPPGAIPSADWTFAARRPADASASLIRQARQLGTRVGLPAVQASPAATRTAGHIAVILAADGPAEAVLSLVAELERTRPLIRLISWKLTPTVPDGSRLRLDAVAESAWVQRR